MQQAASVVNLQWPPGTDAKSLCPVPTVVVEPAPKESALDKFLPTIPSLLLSGMAIYLTIRNLNYTRRKDERARVLSVRDDFWIRKVLAPATIEPLIQYATELANRLPWQMSGHSADDVLEQWGKEVSSIEALRHSFALLKILDQGLWHDIDNEFDQIADLQARYFGDMAQSVSDSTVLPPDPHGAANEFRAITHRILQAIYEHQRDEQPS